MKPSPLNNEALDILNGVISALMSGGETAAEAFVTALDPALFANPFMAWLLDEGVHYIGQILSIAGQKFADQIVIDIQTRGQESDVITAATALAFAVASNDEVSVQNAVNTLGTAYKAVIHFDGFGNPK